AGECGMTKYIHRHGKRIEIETLDIGDNAFSKKKRRRIFRTQWVKLSRRWANALQQSKSVNTYQLAHTILFEAFKREQIGGEIVLSTAVTGMSRSTRRRAIDELVKLKLIEVQQCGNEAVKVVKIF